MPSLAGPSGIASTCGRERLHGQTRQSAAPPPPAASVAHPLPKEVVEWDTYSGNLQSPEMANVAARVSGLIMEMPFKEGTIVKRGDLLAVIDEQPFMVDLDSKLADQQRAESTLAIAQITFQRNVLLKSRHAVADQEYDNAKAACDQAAAALAAANAAVASSRLNLEWCRVRSPIDGRVSNKLVTVGNLVTGGAGQAPPTLLTTVTSVSPMYLYVDVDEHSILKYQKLAEERKLLSARDGKLPCFFELENETDFPHQGSIDFMDNHVDSTTGTIKVRAVLRNDSGKFIPGCFARMRMPGSGRYRTLLVPDDAVGSDQNEHNVLVVDKDNKVQVRPVQFGALFGDLRSIALRHQRRRSRGGQRPDARSAGFSGDADRSDHQGGGRRVFRSGHESGGTGRFAGREGPPIVGQFRGDALGLPCTRGGGAGMKFAAFFIERPVFAAVISIATVVVGAIAALRLPSASFPKLPRRPSP